MKRKVLCLLAALAVACAALAAAQEGEYPLMVRADGELRPAAWAEAPEAFVPAPEYAAPGDTPEYYFVPADGEDPTRFFYYTTGSGDPVALAEAAISSYGMFYDEFRASGIREDELAGFRCTRFDYTCAYPDRTGASLVYEQTAVAYVPLEDGQFIACIASLAFDDPDAYRTGEALGELLARALGAVVMADAA